VLVLDANVTSPVLRSFTYTCFTVPLTAKATFVPSADVEVTSSVPSAGCDTNTVSVDAQEGTETSWAAAVWDNPGVMAAEPYNELQLNNTDGDAGTIAATGATSAADRHPRMNRRRIAIRVYELGAIRYSAIAPEQPLGTHASGRVGQHDVAVTRREPVRAIGRQTVVRRTMVALGMVVMVASCNSPEGSSSTPPRDPGPRLIVIEPDVARPGQVVELRYPKGLQRGVPFFMSRRVNDHWSEPEFLLISDAGGKWTNGPWWYPRGSDKWGWDDLGVSGPGPDRIKVPDVAEPGSYRICTANTGEKSYCVQLTVSA
jgi:hypothetical protein